MNRQIFLSYSRVDRDFAKKLYADLEAQNFTLWRDVHDIPAGEKWWTAIEDAIHNCETMVLCMSLAALRSPIVSDEWTLARQLGKRVIPVIADEVFKHPDVTDGTFTIPNWMGRANWMDFRDTTPEREAAWDNFILTLRSLPPTHQAKVTVKANQLPHNYVARNEELEPLIKALVNENNDAVAITAALRGAGGYGKTTLAKALCRDLRVSGAFDDGVYWVTLGETLLVKTGEALENELTTRVLDLVYEITGTRPPIIKLETAQEELAKAIGHRYILLVVDDAWHSAHLTPFLVKGRHNSTLITTRDDRTLPKDADKHNIDRMGNADALALLTAGLDPKTCGENRPALVALADKLGNWALLLGIVNGALTERVSDYKESLADALEVVNTRLEDGGLTVFDDDNPIERERAAAATLDASLNQLKPDERKRYLELAIFPEDAAVPVAHVASLWGMKPTLAKVLCEKLAKASLLQDYNGQTIRLHDVVRTYLNSKPHDKTALHTQLTFEWGLERTYEVSYLHGMDDYAWEYYAYHLGESGQTDLLRSKLSYYPWIDQKLQNSSGTALWGDYQTARYYGGSASDHLNLIESALQNSLHVVESDKAQLASQLKGRLSPYVDRAEIQSFLDSADSAKHTFNPLNTALNTAGRALLRTLAGHTASIWGALQLSDGRLLSWSSDNTLRLWTSDGTPLAELRGHTASVRDVLELSDDRLLSWSNDHTLRLWASDGKPLAQLHGHVDLVLDALELSDGRLLSWADDKTLRLWASDGTALAELHGHMAPVNGILQLIDDRLLSWADDNTLRLWASDGTLLAELRGHTASVRDVLELSDDRLLSWSDDNTLRLWASDGTPLAELADHTASILGTLELSDGRLLSWAYDNTLRLWASDGTAETVVSLAGLAGFSAFILGVLELSDGRLLSWADDGISSSDNTLRLWASDGTPLAQLHGHTDSIRGC